MQGKRDVVQELWQARGRGRAVGKGFCSARVGVEPRIDSE